MESKTFNKENYIQYLLDNGDWTEHEDFKILLFKYLLDFDSDKYPDIINRALKEIFHNFEKRPNAFWRKCLLWEFGFKYCKHCKEIKERTGYYLPKKENGKISTYCKVCERERKNPK